MTRYWIIYIIQVCNIPCFRGYGPLPPHVLHSLLSQIWPRHSPLQNILLLAKHINFPHFLGQGSLTGRAIKDSWNLMFSAVPRGRKSKLVLLTDGPSNDDVKMPSKWVRDNGVEMFIIGLGSGYNEKQLLDMASTPSDKHIMFKNYDDLRASVQEVRNKVCGFNAMQGLYITEIFTHFLRPIPA